MLDYLKALYRHVTVFDAGARSSATSFAVQQVGDVHVTWENEALREVAESKYELEVVFAPVSIKVEPAVDWDDARRPPEASTRSGAVCIERLEHFLREEDGRIPGSCRSGEGPAR